MYNFLLIWLVPAAITLHNVEEAIWLPGWSKKSIDFWHKPVGATEFRFAVSILTLLAYAVATLTYAYGIESVWGYLLGAYALGQALNIFIPHLVASIATKSYSPGLLSGILFVLPTSVLYIYTGFSAEYFKTSHFIIISVILIPLILLIIPLLFRIGRLF